jgi:16S rRNA (guanine527-N7)-methyltransferase
MNSLSSELLTRSMHEFGIDLTEQQLEQFNRYYSSLMKWNEITNVTSITESNEVIIKHFVDSVSSCRAIDYTDKVVIDIGTGAGFPGLPLKIIYPSMDISFVDSSTKKSDILKKICTDIGIQGTRILIDNIENIGRAKEYRERFDICLARAVASLPVLIEYSLPLLKVGGFLVAYKGPNSEVEVDNSKSSLDLVGGRIKENTQFSLPLYDYRRKIVVVEKLWKTDDKYPRKVGIPKKRPL